MKIERVLDCNNVVVLSYQTLLIKNKPFSGDEVYNFVSTVQYYGNKKLSENDVKVIEDKIEEIKRVGR